MNVNLFLDSHLLYYRYTMSVSCKSCIGFVVEDVDNGFDMQGPWLTSKYKFRSSMCMFNKTTLNKIIQNTRISKLHTFSDYTLSFTV